jgi:radical SAM superfamily enzyme YgiQ (UPF0313 family)
MLTLINANRMQPPVAPIGLDYVATTTRLAGFDTCVLDLCLTTDPGSALRKHFHRNGPRLVGVSFRNVDDCFWPSATSFVTDLIELVAAVRQHSDSPVALGGVGYSIFADRLVEETGADFGIRGDGETATVRLLGALEGRERFADVPGLVWRDHNRLVCNPPAWPQGLEIPTSRDAIDNRRYFELGGQAGVETKRGCPRSCLYCADPVAKGNLARTRDPEQISSEFEALAAQGVDVVHICDGEFNLPRAHAARVCESLIARHLGDRVRWYTYAAVTPFDAELAGLMRRAGCVGINFTSDAGSDEMLATYGHPHRRQHLATAVRLCREHGIACMLDLLLGGPGETPETLADTVAWSKHVGPDCVGASLGLRLYPGTPAAGLVPGAGVTENDSGILRKYAGRVDLLHPTFYISPALGEHPATLVRDLIAGDPRFFPPAEAAPEGHAGGDHNYNANAPLTRAIASGARGAYWDILRRLAPGD